MNITNETEETPHPKLYTKEQVLAMLEKFKYDAIYCNSGGIRFMKVEDYLKK